MTLLNRWIGIQNIVILKTKQVIVETEPRCTIDPPPTAASGRVFFLIFFRTNLNKLFPIGRKEIIHFLSEPK